MPWCFWSAFCLREMVTLPRQARDKHRESTQKAASFVQAIPRRPISRGTLDTSFNHWMPTEFNLAAKVKEKNAFFAMPFDAKNDHFTKTGSGQTYGTV